MPVSLHEHLLNLNTEEQKSLLRQMEAWDKTLTRKAQFAAAIERQLRKNLEEFVARLTDAEKLLLAESARQGTLIGAREFEGKFGSPRPMPKGYYAHNEQVPLLAAVISLPRSTREDKPALAESSSNL